jgi:hypothetical protein
LSAIRILTIRFAQQVVAVDNFSLEVDEGEFISTGVNDLEQQPFADAALPLRSPA